MIQVKIPLGRVAARQFSGEKALIEIAAARPPGEFTKSSTSLTLHARKISDSMFKQLNRYGSALSRRDAPELLPETIRPGIQRAQGKPGGQCTRSLACEIKQSTRA
jgi:hypothetical protein